MLMRGLSSIGFRLRSLIEYAHRKPVKATAKEIQKRMAKLSVALYIHIPADGAMAIAMLLLSP